MSCASVDFYIKQSIFSITKKVVRLNNLIIQDPAKSPNTLKPNFIF